MCPSVNSIYKVIPESTSDITNVFEKWESNVRSYCRSFPTVFTTAKGALLRDSRGYEYIDFFAGAGTLNLGHNPHEIQQHLLDYIASDGIIHALDFFTEAKSAFIQAFTSRILEPRDFDYKLQFTGPTGANAVEAALKLARKATGRSNVIAFMGGYHGLSLGSLAATANRGKRAAAGTPLHDVVFMPFPDGRMSDEANIVFLDQVLSDSHSGIDTPAAIILETIQAEGGVNIASVKWLQQLRGLCDHYGILMICDDIQVGGHRSGPYFSFERAGIQPDIITLSKSLSGIGLPISVVLCKRELDIWQPGEHTGTFRGNQLAFVAGTVALKLFGQLEFLERMQNNSAWIEQFLLERILPLDNRLMIRGMGMIWGVDCSAVADGLAETLSAKCFERGLVIETAGRNDSVLKFLPPLNIQADLLESGCLIVEQALKDCLYNEYSSSQCVGYH